MNKHLTTDELVDRLYGVADGSHVDHCVECTERFRELQAKREMSAVPLRESHEFLAAQRRKVYARMGERPGMRMKWIPALAAAACLMVVGVAVNHSSQTASQMTSRMPSRQIVKQEVEDVQLFSDVYSMEQSMEPLAAKPIHAIFEQDQQ